MDQFARIMIGGITATMAVCLLALLLTHDGPVGTVPVAMTWVAFGGGVIATTIWAWRWPSRRMSIMWALLSNTAIALASVGYPNPLATLIGCVAFATTGAYLAFFHTTGLVIYNFAVATVVAMYAAVQMIAAGHIAMAFVDVWIVLQINIAMPFAISWLIHALNIDLLRADRDPLTGLLNRRAFEQGVASLLTNRTTADRYLLLAVIDLDDFKSVNDTHGHTAGDRALVQVAEALVCNSRAGAVVARTGGEEFLIADTTSAPDPAPIAQRLCAAVAALPAAVTASIGTANARLVDIPDGDYQQTIEALVTAADAAMYHAKRNGGNSFHHHGAAGRSCP